LAILVAMGLRSRFLDAHRVHHRVPGCPLAAPPAIGAAAVDERACGACPYNLLAPGRARIGCEVRTPDDVLQAARTALAARGEALARELEALLVTSLSTTGAKDDATARRGLALAELWYERIDRADADADADAEREVARLLARFFRASLDLGEPVEVLQ
jgi:hypothetical protein